MPAPLIFLVAGEPSGDALGAELMKSLVAESGGRVEFAGVGGPEMEARGMTSIFPMSDLAVMGLVEILPRLATILRRLRQTVRAARQLQPSVVVTIDAQAFSYRLARRLHPAPCPVVHYVAPTVWAWRPGRARKLAAVVDRVLLLFPFEKPWWDAVGQDAVHVGHPVADAQPAGHTEDVPGFPPSGTSGPLLAVLPGSRKAEVRRHLPIFREAVSRLAEDRPGLRVVMPTVRNVAAELRDAADTGWGCPVSVVEADADARRSVMAAADAALAVSGTVALDLGAAGTPHVIAYRAHPVTAAIVRRMVRIEHASLVNLTAGRTITPEFLQQRCTADALHRSIAGLLDDSGAGKRQRKELRDVMTALRHPEGPASRVAARSILEMIGARHAQ